MICLTLDCLVFSNFITSRQCVYEKLEKQSLWSFWGRPKRLLVCHSASKSEMLGLLCHVIVMKVEHHVLPQLRDVNRSHLGTATFTGGKEEI
jgi:hypothetical protein